MAEWRQRPLPQLARGLALLDETPFLRSDGAGVHAIGEVIDRAAGDWVALLDGPFDRRDTAVPGQQRGVIADAAEPGCRQRFLADPGMAVRCDDQLSPFGDFGGNDKFWIGLHDDVDPGRFRGGGEAVFTICHDDPRDLDPVLAQHVERGRTEMAGADEGNPHDLPSVASATSRVSITRREGVSPHVRGRQAVINRRGEPRLRAQRMNRHQRSGFNIARVPACIDRLVGKNNGTAPSPAPCGMRPSVRDASLTEQPAVHDQPFVPSPRLKIQQVGPVVLQFKIELQRVPAGWPFRIDRLRLKPAVPFPNNQTSYFSLFHPRAPKCEP